MSFAISPYRDSMNTPEVSVHVSTATLTVTSLVSGVAYVILYCQFKDTIDRYPSIATFLLPGAFYTLTLISFLFLISVVQPNKKILAAGDDQI